MNKEKRFIITEEEREKLFEMLKQEARTPEVEAMIFMDYIREYLWKERHVIWLREYILI